MTTSPTEDARPRGGPTDRTVPLLARRAMIYGTGLIGGSVGAGLRARGWHVSGVDASPGVADRAVELGAIDGAVKRCIRVMLHVTTERSRDDVHHVYLEGAQGLRDDLPD